MEREFRQKVADSLIWSLGSQVGWQGLNFIVSVILARLLSPREFGLMAMVITLTNFAGIFTELGFGAALIRRQDVQPEHLSSVFWLNVTSGLLLTLLFIVSAPLIADFYQEPSLVLLTSLISINFFINSLGVVQNALMNKNLEFAMLSRITLAAVSGASAVAILMASLGFGVWSLVVQSVVRSVMVTALLWKLNNWRPSFVFNWKAIKDMLGFSTNLVGTQALNYWARNIDNILIGRFLGTVELGVYSRAYTIMLFPIINVSQVISNVLFPSFSLISEDKLRIKQLYLKITRLVALITFPMMLTVFVTAESFVLTVFGSHWAEVIPILQILSLLGITQSIMTLNGSLYLSQNRADLQFRIGSLLRINLILGIIIGLRWGILGVAVGYAIASLLNSYPGIVFVGRLIGLTYIELLRNLAAIFICAVVMAIAVWGMHFLLPAHWPHWAYLIVQVPFGITIYGLLLYFFGTKVYTEAKQMLTEKLNLRHKALVSREEVTL